MNKLISILVTLVTAFVLSACSQHDEKVDSGPMPAPKVVQVPVPTFEQRYTTAKAEVEKIASETAKKAGLTDSAGCAIVPHELAISQSYKDLQMTGASVYKNACRFAVIALRNERKQAELAGVVKHKAREQKVAKLKECGQKSTQKQRDTCRAEAKRHA